jgi:uncharacterized membrane protein HdeD (DUF308 family)
MVNAGISCTITHLPLGKLGASGHAPLSECEQIRGLAVTITAPTSSAALPTWICVLLGIVFLIAGLIVLGDTVAATIISAFLIGVCALVGGAFEIVHAFWTKGWGGFFWQIFLGALYIAAGISLVSQPAAGSIMLTYVLGIVLLVSGLVRGFVGFRGWSSGGWMLVLSGLFGILAGLIILSGWPATGLWVIGFLVGIDLISHGLGWLMLALLPKTA